MKKFVASKEANRNVFNQQDVGLSRVGLYGVGMSRVGPYGV